MTTNSAELKTWPERIYLQHGDEPDVPKFSEVYAADAVTWCMDQINEADVEYIRADLAGRTAAQGEQSKDEVGYCADCNSWGGKHTEECQRRPERFFKPSNKAGSAVQVSEYEITPEVALAYANAPEVDFIGMARAALSASERIHDETQLAIDLARVAHNHVENGEMRHDVGIALLEVVRKHAAPERKVTDAEIMNRAQQCYDELDHVNGSDDVKTIAEHMSALLNQQGEQTAPEGFVIVPKEPTEDMVVAGFESWPDPFFSKPEDWDAYEAMTGCQQAAHRARLCYSAMIEAAPSTAQKDCHEN